MKFITLGLSGKDWIMRLEKGKYQISSYARDLILSKEFEAARPKKGQMLDIQFVKVKDLGKSSATTKELKDYAKEKGWAVPTPEVALLIREAMSDKQMEEMGIWYIAALHDPIKDSDGGPSVLGADRDGGGRWVSTYWGRPGSRWSALGAFAFFLPASQSSETKDLPSDTLSLELRVQALEEWVEHAKAMLKNI